jgi:hypothetical protein
MALVAMGAVAAEPMQFVLEPVSIGGKTTVGQIVDRFAFNRKLILHT